MCGSLHMRICVLEFCGYYIHTFMHIWQVSFVFTMFVTAIRQKPHYYVIPIPNVIILFGKLHPNGHLVSQKFISAVIPLLSSLVRLWVLEAYFEYTVQQENMAGNICGEYPNFSIWRVSLANCLKQLCNHRLN